MASKETDSGGANMEIIVSMLKRQEENLNKRLDMLETKIDSFNLEIIEKIKVLDKRVEEVEKSAEFIGQQYESQKKTGDDLMKFPSVENEELKKEIKALRIDQEGQKSALNELEQHGRRECIEISGVPPKENENTEEITIALGKEIGVVITKEGIAASHRAKKSKGDPIIITKFVNRKKKEEMRLHTFLISDLEPQNQVK